MARRIITQVWPVQDLSAVCNLQSGGMGALILNGTLSSPLYPNTPVSFLNAGFIRNVSISSADDLSLVTFTINGSQNGRFVTEGIAGPNATTVSGAKFYDVITSITVDMAVTNVTVGTGKIGFLPLIQLNDDNLYPFWSISWNLSGSTGFIFKLWQSLDDIFNNGTPFRSSNFPKYQVGMDMNVSGIIQNTGITNILLTEITANTAPLTDTINLTFMQG